MTNSTFVHHQQCSSMGKDVYEVIGSTGILYRVRGVFNERQYPSCSCPAYTFGKRTVNFGGRLYPHICKHIEQVQRGTCTWHSMFGVHQQEDKVCPLCGSPADIVVVAV